MSPGVFTFLAYNIFAVHYEKVYFFVMVHFLQILNYSIIVSAISQYN